VTLWEAAIQQVLEAEGGVSDHPDDPGGVTNWGISLRAFPHLGRDGILNLTREDAIELYREHYWSRVPDVLPDGLRWMVFDAAVNHGVSRAMTWLSYFTTVEEYAAERLRFYAGLASWTSFGRGWVRRIANLLSAIKVWELQQDAGLRYADTLVLHGLRVADRWVAVSRDPVTLRGEFAYRVRGEKVDLRRVR
jgi:lysozyme family protein